MNKKKAIEILQGQLAKLEDKKQYKDETWVFQTASYIKQFFGEQSEEYTFIGRFTFSFLGHTGMSDEMWRNGLRDKQEKAKKFIQDCIETIGNKGLYNDPNSNFLNRLSDTAIWTIIGISIPGLLGIGFMFGQYITDTKNFELKQQVKQLQDSLSLIPSFSNSNPKTDTTTILETATHTISTHKTNNYK